MKILILSNRFFSIYNSRQKIIKELLKRGTQIVILANFDGYEAEIKKIDKDNIKCINYSFNDTSKFIKHLFKTSNIIKSEKPNIVHAFNPLPIFITGILKFRFRFELLITITGLGGAYGHGSKWVPLFDKFYLNAIKRSDRAIFQNKDDCKYFAKKISKAHLNKLQLITSSGVDLERFKQKKLKSYSNSKFKILFISRLINQKGISYLYEIAKHLLVYKDIEIIIYGEYVPKHNDTISKHDYQKLLELSNVYFKGFVKEIEEEYVNNDLLICCSLREGVPRVILESSASGLPVVAFDVTGVREGVENNVNGFLIPAFDINQFVEKILLLKEDFTLYKNISMNSRKYIINNFSQEIILEKYMNIYDAYILKIN